MGDIKPTIRLRTAASYRLDGPWRLGASISSDILGKGGGWFGDVGLGWEQKIEAHTTFTLGAGGTGGTSCGTSTSAGATGVRMDAIGTTPF